MAENFFGQTDTGKVREKNEDTFIAQKAMNNKFIIACAIDGVGGYSGGEVAADIARKSILEYFKSPSEEMLLMMKDALILANKEIYTERQHVKEHAEMACVLTLAIVDIENNQFYYAHIGDTRLYLFRDNSLVKVSRDHSFVGFLEDSGRLTEDSAMRHPKRNEINKALGFGNQIEIEPEYIQTGQSPFLPEDILLLCTDGLTDMVNKKDITDVLVEGSSLKEKAAQLISAANKNGGKDNITVVLVQNDKTPLAHEATRPAAGEKKTSTDKASAPEYTEIIRPEEPLKQRRSSGPNIILSILCFVLLGCSLYLLWQKGKAEERVIVPLAPVQKIKNEQETRLQNAINSMTGDTLILSDSVYTGPIVVSDTLYIDRDSLYILAKGNIIIERDSSFAGPAFMLSSQCNYIVMDSLIFSNFDIGISAQNNALFLKNVRFNNCGIPVQNLFTLAQNQYVNGRIPDTPFRADSLPKIPGR